MGSNGGAHVPLGYWRGGLTICYRVISGRSHEGEEQNEVECRRDRSNQPRLHRDCSYISASNNPKFKMRRERTAYNTIDHIIRLLESRLVLVLLGCTIRSISAGARIKGEGDERLLYHRQRQSTLT